MPELNHSNHEGITFLKVEGELRATVTATGGDPTPTAVTVNSSRTLTNDDHNKVLIVSGDRTLTLPNGLMTNFITTVLVPVGNKATFATSGGATASPSGVVLDGVGMPAAASVLRPSTTFFVIARERPDTVTVHYSGGWPASRPFARTVIAVGHTDGNAPAWFTSMDVHLYEVS